ncbi:MAG: hypothetical protein H6595_02030 [Flavobacteriales bacterium]|nr:hypothetical protein [Flavobacteriales bacterium]MCB9166236.1 hypothetical protein [Flavobacteriales bacterium]
MRPTTLTTILGMALAPGLSAQDLMISSTASTELTKAAREGRYGGTFIQGDKATVLYVSSTKAEGAQVEEYVLDLGGAAASVGERFIDAGTAENQLPWFMPRSRVEKISEGNGKWLKAGRAFGGGMKLWLGHVQKNYYLGVYTGMEFVEEESVKPKAGDIWRITPGGFKSLSDLDALATSDGFYQDLQKYGNPLAMPADADMLAAGVITEKVKLSTDQEFAANRVAVLTMNGKDLENIPYDIYLLPYTAMTVTSGLGQGDDLCSLFAPLNGPTTLASLKHLYWKDNKNHFTYMRFSDDRKLVDSVSFQSTLMWGDFEILNDGISSYVVGKGKDGFDGWYRGMNYSKMNAMQVTRIQDGKVQYNTYIGEDALEGKLVVPAGEKAKLDWYIANSHFKEVVPMPNGDVFIVGNSPAQAFALQLSPLGEYKALHFIPMMGKEGETGMWTYQTMIKGDDLILVANQRPVEFATEAQIESHTSKSYGAGVTTTITTTTVTKLNEVFLQSQVVRINATNATMSNALQLDGRDWYPMGSFPAMFTTDAIYFTGREKGPKGKVIHVARVDL